MLFCTPGSVHIHLQSGGECRSVTEEQVMGVAGAVERNDSGREMEEETRKGPCTRAPESRWEEMHLPQRKGSRASHEGVCLWEQNSKVGRH